MNKKHLAFNWCFLNPVDPVALGIPQYPTIVKHPMDLGTIKSKIDSGAYAGADEYEADVRLMLSNCYLFNGVGSDIYNIGKQFEAFFDLKISDRGGFMNQHGESRTKSFSYSDSDDDGIQNYD
jgi:bromodomain-containing factor 1